MASAHISWATARNPRATIVMFSDVFSLELPNNKLIADAYAKSGEYLVYLPDFTSW